jgi:arylsulfatase A-like enzyme
VGLIGLTLGLAGVDLVGGAVRERRLLARAPAAAAGAPNVLLIVLDTVRAMNLSLYGYGRPTSPELERWAAGGVVFDRAYATAPWTLPSHASIMTGRWVHELSADWMVPLDAAYPTLAEALGAAGYATGGFVANTDYCSAEVGLDRGFARYEDYTLAPGQLLRNSALWRAIARIRPLRAAIGNYDNLGRKLASDINAAFLAWVDGRHDRPFFAFLNYYDAHRPYLPPDPFARRFVTPGVAPHSRYRKEDGNDPTPPPERVQGAIDAYDNATAYLDAELGRLFGELERRGRLVNTIVVLTSDHGEEFMEHGVWDHGSTLFATALHVPLLVRWPAGGVPAGLRVADPVSLRDIPATVTDLLRLRPAGGAFPGRSLARRWAHPNERSGDPPLMAVRQVPRQPEWYPVSKGHMVSAVMEGLHYIRNLGDGSEQLFDVLGDPLERTDLSADSERSEAMARFRLLTEGQLTPPRQGRP